MCHAIRARRGGVCCLRNIVGSVSRWCREAGVFGRPRGDEALDRGQAPACGGSWTGTVPARSVSSVARRARTRRNFIAQKFARSVGNAATTSTAATVRDTPPASPGWRRYSERAGGRARTRRVKRPNLILLWGSKRARDAPDLLSPSAQGPAERRTDVRRRSATDELRAVGGALGGARCGLGHRARQPRSAARSSPRGSSIASSSRTRRTGFEDYRRGVEPYTLAYAERETGVPAATIRTMAHEYARARRAMICWTLGITEHHNAGRQRAGARQPLFADRPRRPLRLGAHRCAAEQRPGRRRHGGLARSPARFRARRERRVPVEVRSRVGCPGPARALGWHLSADVRGEWSAAICAALYVIGENPLPVRRPTRPRAASWLRRPWISGGAGPGRPRTGAVLADDVERAQIAALHRLEHLRQVASRGSGGTGTPHARSNFDRNSSFSTCWKPGRRSGKAPMSPPPWTLFCPRSGLSPEP